MRKITITYDDFNWILFIMRLMRSNHWFRWWLGAEQATSHYQNQWWHSSVTQICWIMEICVKGLIICLPNSKTCWSRICMFDVIVHPFKAHCVLKEITLQPDSSCYGNWFVFRLNCVLWTDVTTRIHLFCVIFCISQTILVSGTCLN